MQDAPDLTAAEPIPPEAMPEVERLLGSGDLFRYTAEEAPVALLEAEFAAFLGSRYALAVSSCSAGLFLALKALDLPPGARVLVPAFTFAAVPSAVLHAGLAPVLVECGADYRVDLDDFAAKLPGSAAVLLSHMRGHISDMDRLLALADAAGVRVIEDAAHALGARWRGRRSGTLGAIGCFSFQSYKLLNAGEGGMIVSDDPDLIARMVIMSGAYERNWRRHPVLHAACARWQNELPLYNMRLGNLSAAILRPQVRKIDARAAAGRRNHAIVAERLAGLPGVEVPGPLEGEERAPDSIQFNLPHHGEGELRALAAAVAARGLDLQLFGLAEGNARAFWNWRFLGEPNDLPRTRTMLLQACDLRLPPRLTPADCMRIADILADAFAEVAPRSRAVA